MIFDRKHISPKLPVRLQYVQVLQVPLRKIKLMAVKQAGVSRHRVRIR